MSEQPQRPPRKRGWWAVGVVVALLLLPLAWLLVGDQRIREATAQLHEGMTAAELQALLRRVPSVRMSSEEGVDITIFGADEFIHVHLDQDGDNGRVTRVEHVPDLGPWYERLKRRWEHRFR